MTAKDQRNLKILGVLVLIAGLTWYLVYHVLPSGTGTAAKAAVPAKPKTASGSTEARIRLDLLDGGANDPDAGRKNVFQYRPKPEPPRPPAPPPPPPPPPVAQRPVTPQTPPLPPFKQFTFEGIMYSGPAKAGPLIASLTDTTNFIYRVREGETILGQYRVTRVTESSVEIEDIVQKRRQSFTKVQR